MATIEEFITGDVARANAARRPASSPTPFKKGGSMQRFVKRLLIGGLAVAGLVTMLDAGAATPVTFQLNWYAGGPNAGFAAAVAEGYYKGSTSRWCRVTARATPRSSSPAVAPSSPTPMPSR
jgi:hypothetical protein